MANAGLQMLLFSLQRDPEAASQLVSISGALVRELKPLSLYSHADAAKAGGQADTLSSVSNFVLSLAKESPESSAEMVSLVLRLAASRGSLRATLEIVRALFQTPRLLKPEHRDCLELLLAVDSCEDELLSEHFGPPPGSPGAILSQFLLALLSAHFP